jgi:hypothetical protein
VAGQLADEPGPALRRHAPAEGVREQKRAGVGAVPEA